jgi:DNA-binding NtrC family response regulator
VLGSKVALVVDDEVFARLMAIQILLEADYCVLEASNAAEAFDVLERNDDISLLITDISMPGATDGLGLARSVLEERPHVSTVLTSGFSPPPGTQMPARAKFIAKPYSAHGLKLTIREAEEAGAVSC